MCDVKTYHVDLEAHHHVVTLCQRLAHDDVRPLRENNLKSVLLTLRVAHVVRVAHVHLPLALEKRARLRERESGGVRVYIRVYKHMYTCLSLCIYMYTCMHMCLCVCVACL